MGCQTTGVQFGDHESDTSSQQASYSYFNTPADHLEELVENKKYKEASKVYNENYQYFIDNFGKDKKPDNVVLSFITGGKKKEQEAIDTLAKKLTVLYKPDIVVSLSELEDIQWPEPKKDWKEVKIYLEKCQKGYRRDRWPKNTEPTRIYN